MSRTDSWKDVEEEGRLLVEALGGRWTAQGGLCRCPAHADRRPSLSVRPGRTRLLLHCFAGCLPQDILRALSAGRLLTAGAAGPPGPDREAGVDMGAAALRLWGAARAIGGTAAETYLAARGVGEESRELRYHARTPHGPKPFTRMRPALIAAVRDNRNLVAVHRSFLHPCEARLADLPEPRCGLGRFGRGAVRLGGFGAILGLAEGIETARSASILFGVPCWATLGTERFGLVELPAGVETLWLFLDHDAGGRRAEALARAAHAGIPEIETHMPRRPGFDWNDVLMARLRAKAGVERRGSG